MRTETTTHTSERWTDERVEKIIGNLLRAGVIIAAVLCAVGGVSYVVANGGKPVDYGAFHGEPSELRSVPGILAQAAGLASRGLIQLGLLALILTPIARVAFSIFAFALQRDRMYVAITAIVLALLIFSLLGG